MLFHKLFTFFLVGLFLFGNTHTAEAKKKRRHRAGRIRYSGPPPTHPVVLWARTLGESTDREQRKIAAFKLSQYSITIHQEKTINAIIKCMGENDTELKVLCAKAMAKAGTEGQVEWVRKALIEKYQADPTLRNTLVRTFTARKDRNPLVHDMLLESVKKTEDEEELLTLLSYFESMGHGTDKFVDAMVKAYSASSSTKVKRAVVQALTDRAHGQKAAVEIFLACSDDKDTPLALNCLSGLQMQAKKDPRVWDAVKKSVQSSDADVLMSSLDLINSLGDSPQPEVSARLVELIKDTDDGDVQEKAILALGVCGDYSEPVVGTLIKVLEDGEAQDSAKIAAALVVGKEAQGNPDKARTLLLNCMKQKNNQSLATACQLGFQELKNKKPQTAVPSPSPLAPPAKVAEPQTKSEKLESRNVLQSLTREVGTVKEN